MKFVAISLASLALLGGCATSNPDVVNRYETQRLAVIQDATVLSVRPVTIDGQQSGIGGASGAMVGAVAGGSRGNYRDSAVGSVIGMVVGAVVGNAIERSATTENGVEIVLQMRNGERRSLVQAKGDQSFAPGDAVVLTSSAGRTRVEHAPRVESRPDQRS
ncbi:MAG TPA: glycine zipper domain-containing protein [Burkholderiaceae bacterium]